MSDEEAIANVQGYFNINEPQFDSPIARQVWGGSYAVKPNIVLVLMEGLSAHRMSRYGCPDGVTPVLDSLAKISWTFDNCYSAGTHTYNGVYGTLFSFPSILRKQPMKGVEMLQYSGLPSTLRSHGYRTIYFTTHDDQFDNIGGFIKANGVEETVTDKNYPSDKRISIEGVADDYMFEYSIPIITELASGNSPFFATYLTSTNHPPYVLPDYGSDYKHKEIDKQAVEYSDWAIGKFMKLAKEQPWYEKTIFIFISDHGRIYNGTYDMPLSYNHVPFIIHGPNYIEPKVEEFGMAGQIDMFPTVMGLLNLSYINNTMGVDLGRHTRPFIYFNADDRIGCINEEYFLVLRTNGVETLYRYRTRDQANYIQAQPELVEEMKRYTYSMLQATQWLTANRKVGPQK